SYALVKDAAAVLHRDAPKALRSNGPSLRTLALIPAGVTLVAGVVSAVLFSQAFAAYRRIPQADGDVPIADADARALAASGRTMQVAAWALAGVAGAALVTAGALFIVGRPP